MRRIGRVALTAAILFSPIIAKSAELQDAFKAAFGQAPPIMRHANLQMEHQEWGETDLRLDPVLLVQITGTRFALIISETSDGAHEAGGDVAVAYLDHHAAGWRLVQVWYEFAESGSFGIPFPRHKVWSFNFGGTPFFAGESEWCGDGACARGYELIGFSPDRPVDWGGIASSGSFEPAWLKQPNPLPDGDGLTGCGGYEYSSIISSPRHKGDVLRVTYTGWMIPGGEGQKRRDFHISTEVALTHGRLILQPKVQIPNCGS